MIKGRKLKMDLKCHTRVFFGSNNRTIRLCCLLLIATSILTCFSGCQNTEIEEFSYFEHPPIRTREEIQQTGVTAEDVIVYFDKLCLDLLKAESGDGETIIQEGKERYNKIDVRISSIKGARYEDGYKEGYGPFYSSYEFFPVFSNYKVEHKWFKDSSNKYYNSESLVLEKACLVTIWFESYREKGNFLISKATGGSECFINLAVPASVMKDLLDLFDVEKYTMTDEIASGLRNPSSADDFLLQEVYDFEEIRVSGFVFDENQQITFWNQEQLDALWRLIYAIEQVNLYGVCPVEFSK